MEYKLSIFPYKAKCLGFALVVLALPFAYLYFWGGKPEIFNVRIFAFVTTYLETRYFVLSQTNILDELAAVLTIIGIALISFSKEKDEQEYFEAIRIKALIAAVYFTIAFWLLSFFFIYGMAIFIVSFFIFIVFILAYNSFFRYYLLKNKRNLRNT
ncbi:hypothetical protein [Sunxiuqinia indica]|uniref:hypothetical protein n=1 Tax=Sunxiuqinia indica TaxID=2692584 RepID=UPI0013593921|nr:hypothetical protein [Sunxiuqinia indica]